MQVEQLFGVKDKVVLVTGGGRGIGLMIVKGFVANGATVYISSRDEKTCEKIAAELTQQGPGKCFALKGEDLGKGIFLSFRSGDK